MQEDSKIETHEPEGVRPLEELQELPLHSWPVQPSRTPPTPIFQPAPTKRKRPQDSEAKADELEDVRLSEQSQGLHSSKHELFEENL